jgi:S1-C subfamily serine protease
VETVNTPLGRVNAPLGAAVQSAFVPGTTVSVPTTVVFNPTSPELTIQSLDPAGLYYQSGLRQGDVVLSSNGAPIQTQADFERLTAANPSQPLPLIVRRNGQEQPIEVRPRQVPGGRAHLGVRFDLDAHNAAMISSVTPGTPAEAAGLRPGDIITVINGEPITSYQQVFQFLAALRPGNQLDIRFTRRVENQTKVTLDSRPLPTQTAGVRTRAPAEQIVVPPASNGQALPK